MPNFKINMKRYYMQKVYIETSIVSFLTARPSSNLLTAAWQNITTEWWERRRNDFQIFTSELVWEEARRGDKKAALRRQNVLEGIPLLELTESAVNLAKALLSNKAVPHKATDDAFHIALASVHCIDYLLTWNFRHIHNAETKPLIREVVTARDYRCPEICTPQELLGGGFNGE
jgi:predicted nucleic acid-binding protein